jgi:hypothetical protein
MMRVEPDDQNDIRFLVAQLNCSLSHLESALSRAVVPPIQEIQEAFSKNHDWLRSQFGV